MAAPIYARVRQAEADRLGIDLRRMVNYTATIQAWEELPQTADLLRTIRDALAAQTSRSSCAAAPGTVTTVVTVTTTVPAGGRGDGDPVADSPATSRVATACPSASRTQPSTRHAWLPRHTARSPRPRATVGTAGACSTCAPAGPASPARPPTTSPRRGPTNSSQLGSGHWASQLGDSRPTLRAAATACLAAAGPGDLLPPSHVRTPRRTPSPPREDWDAEAATAPPREPWTLGGTLRTIEEVNGWFNRAPDGTLTCTHCGARGFKDHPGRRSRHMARCPAKLNHGPSRNGAP